MVESGCRSTRQLPKLFDFWAAGGCGWFGKGAGGRFVLALRRLCFAQQTTEEDNLCRKEAEASVAGRNASGWKLRPRS